MKIIIEDKCALILYCLAPDEECWSKGPENGVPAH